MTALTEDAGTYPAEIYQLEVTDPVLGGPPNEGTGAGMSNIPHKQLADRTAYLNQTKAPKDSPVFTGTPAAPTPLPNDRSTRVATTAWVMNAMASLAAGAGFGIRLEDVGYIQFPSWLGGLVIQWSKVTGVVNGSTTIGGVEYAIIPIVWAITFPNTVFMAVASGGAPTSGEGDEMNAGVQALTTSGANVRLSRVIGAYAAGQSASAHIIAVGY